MNTFRIRVSGKVQGVWFRASAKDKALELGVNGKIWNESNGDVGIIAQGSETQLTTFIAWCKIGPPLARVEDVRVEQEDHDVAYNSFIITR